jgi:predicted nucleic acid-binding Zn ribbon protein
MYLKTLKNMAFEQRYKKPSAARKQESNQLSDIIERLIDTYKLRGKYNETYIIAHWEKLVGTAIANRTTQLYFTDKKLYIQVNSSPLRSELFLAKTKFIKMLNEDIGSQAVEDIVFI